MRLRPARDCVRAYARALSLQAVGMAQDFYTKVAAIQAASKAKDQETAVCFSLVPLLSCPLSPARPCLMWLRKALANCLIGGTREPSGRLHVRKRVQHVLSLTVESLTDGSVRGGCGVSGRPARSIQNALGRQRVA